MSEQMTVKGFVFTAVDAPKLGTTYEVTSGGRHLCPLCSSSPKRQYIGYYSERALVNHLAKQHYRCEDCGWVGISPSHHVAREVNHGGTKPFGRKKGSTMRELRRLEVE